MTTMVCPLCGRQHPTGTTYCPVMWSEIPAGAAGDPFAGRPPVKTMFLPGAQPPEEPTVALGGAMANSSSSFSPSAAQTQVLVRCANCGDHWPPGGQCGRCHQPLSPSGPPAPPAAEPETPTAEPKPAAAPTLLRLPSGESLSIPRDTEVLIGRKSEIPDISQALEPFDMVGRHHCYVTVSPDGDAVTVRDPGSTNGTWVGDAPERVAPDEKRTATLPVRIRLGRYLCVIVEREESGQ